MRWMYGVTTVPSRRATLLPKTLASLEGAGFSEPHLFVDGEPDPVSWRREFDLDVTAHHPRLGTVGNWVTALWTLYILEPDADRYAVFQDDVIFCRGLREYLDQSPWMPGTYLNLYSSEYNEPIVAKAQPGTWCSSFVLNSSYLNDHLPIGPGTDRWQAGKGALALVFDSEAVIKMLGAESVARKPKFSRDDFDRPNGHKKVDGMVVNAMNQAGFKEMVHAPSLCQHIGQLESSMGNSPRPLACSFPGESFHARTFLPKRSS